jgi:hypothetical protein
MSLEPMRHTAGRRQKGSLLFRKETRQESEQLQRSSLPHGRKRENRSTEAHQKCQGKLDGYLPLCSHG